MGFVETIEPKRYARAHGQALRQIAKRLDDYLEDPNEDNIHGARIAVRRLRVSTSLLPRQVRKGRRIERYIEGAKKFFRLTSTLRDLDIIQKELKGYSLDPGSGMLTGLEKKRRKASKRALREGRKLRRLKKPRLKAKSVDAEALTSRFIKMRRELTTSLQNSFSIAARDETRTDEVHSMRKSIKKLRYAIELFTMNKSSERVLRSLEKWQDALGEIHDHDTFIAFLKTKKVDGSVQEIMDEESKRRNEQWRSFRASFEIVQLLGSFAVVAA